MLVAAPAAHAAVIEFYNPDLGNYFITADPVEQDFVDSGAVGRWERTGGAFAAGGPDLVCRFGGNGNINPATGTFFGPNSHFYTASPSECAGLKAQFMPGAKSWKFESNDFATTATATGSCPTGLVPVYRAYNNGFARGIDSNHRITADNDSYLQTVAAGWIGEGVVMCAPNSGLVPTPTAVGNAAGEVTSKTIGPAGGSLSSTDGRITVVIPPGALGVDTVIGIQPIEKPALTGAVGGAYRLTPNGQTFLKPVTITFTYADADVEDSAPEFLDIAFQNAEGYWELIGEPALDVGAKSVSVGTTHFTDFVVVSKWTSLFPRAATVRVNGSVALQIRVCVERAGYIKRSTLRYLVDCDAPQGAGVSLSVNEWSVNGVPGGNGVIGRVQGSGANATYIAPPVTPSPNTVVVSARVHFPSSAGGRSVVLRSRITITDADWVGKAESRSPVVTAKADVEWHHQSSDNNVVTYLPRGSVSVVVNGCQVDPSQKAITAADGFLTIDYNFDPPRYHGIGTTEWRATWICGKFRIETTQLAWFFGGSKGPNGRTEGTVEPDGNTIQGTDSVEDFVLEWKFIR